MEDRITSYLQSKPELALIEQAANHLGIRAFLIGGCVRDLLLNRGTPKDLDIVAEGSGIDLARTASALFPGKPKVSVFKTYGTAQFRYGDTEYEFVGARKESYAHDSRNPVVEDGTLADDQNRRDFTINALAIGLNGKDKGVLLDPFNGRAHLEERIIQTPLNPEVTFCDDPLRMLRAIRFATQLNFTIVPQALQAIRQQPERLDIITRERIVDELHKIMAAPRPGIGLALLYETGLIQRFLPEIARLQGVEEVEGQLHKDNFYHTLEVVDNLAQNSTNLWLRYAALFHDIGKPVTKRFDKQNGWTFHGHEFVGSKMIPGIFKRLKMPLNEKMKYVQKLVMLSSRPIVLAQDVTDSAVRRLLFDAGEDIDDLMLLCEADITTKNPRRKKRYLENFQLVREKLKEVEEKDRLRNWQPPIGGEDIMKAFHLTPGPEIGEIKNAIREAILDGEIENTFESAHQFMLAKGRAMGLQPLNPKA